MCIRDSILFIWLRTDLVVSVVSGRVQGNRRDAMTAEQHRRNRGWQMANGRWRMGNGTGAGTRGICAGCEAFPNASRKLERKGLHFARFVVLPSVAGWPSR